MAIRLGGFFFFKQKTAYEIVSRDWSSDVCSSDLLFDRAGEQRPVAAEQLELLGMAQQREDAVPDHVDGRLVGGPQEEDDVRDELVVVDWSPVELGLEQGR